MKLSISREHSAFETSALQSPLANFSSDSSSSPPSKEPILYVRKMNPCAADQLHRFFVLAYTVQQQSTFNCLLPSPFKSHLSGKSNCSDSDGVEGASKRSAET